MPIYLGTRAKCGLRLTSACLPHSRKIEKLVDGVHSFEELAESFRRRHDIEMRRT